LPGGGELRTLLDAGRYIAALPRATQERREWRIATEMLLMVAEGRRPNAFAESDQAGAERWRAAAVPLDEKPANSAHNPNYTINSVRKLLAASTPNVPSAAAKLPAAVS
jgi:hypothetical protein